MQTVTELIEILSKAIKNDLNVLLQGPLGVGKSSILHSVAQELGLHVKYFSTPTLDPFADLVGVPVPVFEDQTRRLVYLRPDCVQQADILFFDELNRAHPKVLNAVFEIIQSHTINGERLPRLRCVLAAVNPASGVHDVHELDPALLDRFHIHLNIAFGPNRDWFVKQFGDRLGHALVAWYHADLDAAQRALVSNRRLEFIGRAIKADIDPGNAFQEGTKPPVHLLQARLCEEDSVLSIEQFVSDPEKFSSAVSRDLNVAVRFAHLLPMMTPKQTNIVRDLVLALPAELLAKLKSDVPFVFKKTRKAAAQFSTPADAHAFEELLNERLRELDA